MRFTPATLALASVLLTVSSAGIGQRADSQISPLSLEWQARGEQAKAAKDFMAANDALESALAADPRNRRAFVLLGEIAREQGLQGKAIRFYNEALVLDPADMDALAGQGQAMVEKGALEQARANIARMKSVCRKDCPQIDILAASVEEQARKSVAKTAPAPAVNGAPAAPETQQP